jgi:hypothetical protein
MKTSAIGLTTSTGTTYDKTRTSLLGRAFSKVVSGQTGLGPALTGFIDVQTVTGIAPSWIFFVPSQNLLFCVQNTTTVTPSVTVFNFNRNTGANSYIGRVILRLGDASSTHAIRGFAAWTDGTNVRLILASASSSPVTGGIYVAYCTLSQFTPSGTTIWGASGPGQNAVYQLTPPDYYGVNAAAGFQNATWGVSHPYLSPSSGINTKVYSICNTVAAPVLFGFDLATTPNVAGQVISGINCVASTVYANTYSVASPNGCYFNSATLPGYQFSTTVAEVVALLNGTATVPTGTNITAWTPGSAQTTGNTYVLRDAQRQYSLTALSLPTSYNFTVTATTQIVYAGTRYTNNSQTFTVPAQNAAGVTALSTVGTGAPTGSGNLTLAASQRLFTITALPSAIVQGAVYTHNGQSYTINASLPTGATFLVASETGAPLASGTLTLSTGTGPATIAFSAQSTAVGQATIAFSANTAVSGIVATGAAPATYTNTYSGQTFTFHFVQNAAAGTTALVVPMNLNTNATNIQVPESLGVLVRTSAASTGPATITYTAATGGGFFFNIATISAPTTNLVPTSTSTGFTLLRAYGMSTNQFIGRTPITGLPGALTGTLVTSNILNYARPQVVPQNTALNNTDCLALATASNLYLGRISELFPVMTTGDTTFNSNAVTGIPSTTGIVVGMAVVGPAIPAGVVVASVGTGTITLSQVANSTTTGSGLMFGTNNWASLTTSNALGTGIDMVPPTIAFSRYGATNAGDDIDRFVYVTGLSTLVVKSLQNNVIQEFVGGTSAQYLETLNLPTVSTGLAAMAGLECRGGWVFMANGTTVGQRGIVYADIWSDHSYGNTALISAIQYVAPGTLFKFINTIEALFDRTASSYFWIRSAATESSSVFDAANIPTVANPNGWTLINTGQDLQSVAIGPYFQIAITYITLDVNDQTPAQINDVNYTYILPGEASDKWAPSVENTTQSADSPMFVAWRLQTDYSPGPVPTLYVRGYDDAGNMVASFNTSANAAAFQYSTNNGTSWVSLGTIPNVALTTELRVNIATPPVASFINWSISET